MTTDLLLRNADMKGLIEALREQAVYKHDVIVPARSLVLANDRTFTVPDPEAITETGVGDIAQGTLSSTAVGDLAELTGIPVAYLRRCLADADGGHLSADNVNHWLDKVQGNVLLRSFRGEGDDPAYVRCIRSDRFRPYDNLDAIMAVAQGFIAAGTTPEVLGADLTEGRMDVRFACPSTSIEVPELVGDYRYGNRTGLDEPRVCVGYSLRNGETGGSSLLFVPQIRVLVCKNGLTVTKDSFRKVHLGGQLAEGKLEWSAETLQRSIELIKSQVADVIKTTLTTTWLQEIADEMSVAKGTKVTKPMDTIKVVGRSLKWTDAEIDSVLSQFVLGGDMTALGVGQAWTARAHTLPTGQAQAEAEDAAWEVIGAAVKAVATVG